MRGGLLLIASNATVSVLQLARNILIARLIGVEDYGVAATFAITMALIEMMSNIALDRLIVQDREGDGTRLQASVQALQVARGALGGAILFALAGPMARLFGVPDLVWAYQMLALLPFMRGFLHLDIYRAQRAMNFRPVAITEVSAYLLSTALGVWLALELRDYRAMLYALLAQQALLTLVSHLAAKRGYRLGWDRALVGRAFAFGWPLLLNGALMFGIFQGDRMIVASEIGLVELGWFSAAFTLALTPSLLAARTLQSFALPQLSKAQEDPTAFAPRAAATLEGGLFLGVGFAAAFALAGPPVFLTLFGADFAAALGIVALLGAMQGVRMAKAGPVIVATAKAHTKNPLYANIVRVLALPVAFVLVLRGGGVEAVIWAALGGEAASLAASLWLVRRRLGVRLRPVLPALAVFIAAIGGIVYYGLAWPPDPARLFATHPAQALVLLAPFAALAAAPALRRAAMAAMRR